MNPIRSSFFKSTLLATLALALPLGLASPSNLSAQPACQNILIIYDSSGVVTNALNILQNVANQTCGSIEDGTGHVAGLCTTVTTSTSGVPGGSLSGYTEIWDLRFNQGTCNTSCPSDALSASDQTAYEGYLSGGGSLYVLGDNGGFAGRNASVVSFVQTVSGSTWGSTGISTQGGGGCCAQLGGSASSANNFPTNWKTLNGPLPGAVGGQIWTEFGGYVNDLGSGIPVYVDDDPSDPTPSGGSPEAIVTAFPSSSLVGPYNSGKLLVGLDWQIFKDNSSGCGGHGSADGSAGSEGDDANSAFILNAFTFLAATVPTPTPTNTPTKTSTSSPTKTATNSPTKTPTLTSTLTATPTPTNSSTKTPTLTPTNTATSTATNSPTRTPTNSPTLTTTLTPTQSPTNSATNTPTNTPVITNTATNSPTVTPTNTPSNTSTLTPTKTPTNSPTLTPTLTFTRTPTNSVTDTPTDTPLITNTATNTPTVTPTSTPTNSATNTPTSTVTNSPTNSPTATNTSSFTNTPTQTPTLTITNSATNSPTATPTNTVTSTFTTIPGVSLQKLSSTNLAGGGDAVTYSLNVNVTGIPASGVTVQDTLPTGISFVAFLTAPSGTQTGQNGQSLQWVLPPLTVGSYQMTYAAKLKDLLVGGSVLTNNAQLTGPALPVQTASANVTVQANFTVKIGVFNSAGELVKELLVVNLSKPIQSLDLTPGNTITSLNGQGNSIQISSGGIALGSWDGITPNGIPASNGTYYLKVDNIDSFGAVTSVIRPVMVDRQLAHLDVSIYNEAGEVVRHLLGYTDDPKGITLSSLDLSSNVVVPSAQGNGTTPSTVQIIVQTSVSPTTLLWDGKNDGGSFVSSGHYQIAVHFQDGQGSTQEITRGILVAGPAPSLGDLAAWPNIIQPATGTHYTEFKLGSNDPNSLKVSIYDAAGELIAKVQGAAGANSASWSADGVASGFYIAVVEIQDPNGRTTQRKLVKLVVIR